MKKKILLAFISVLTLMTILSMYMIFLKKGDIQEAADRTLESLTVANNAILDTYIISAKIYFNHIMQSKNVLKILQEFKYSNNERKAILRGKLFRELYKEYETMKTFNVRQFHFHTHDGKSLLRFHKVTENGDSLMKIRKTVKVANTELKAMHGFEGGRIYTGYRYIFPIIYEGDHLGSVEFSVALEGIEKKLKEILSSYAYMLLLEKRVSYDRVFKKHQKYFTVSEFSKEYFIENHIISLITKNTQDDKLINRLIFLSKNTQGFTKKLQQKDSFALPLLDNKNGYVLAFLKITDTDNLSAGYLVSFEKLHSLVKIDHKYNIFIILGVVGSGLLFILILIIIYQIQKIKDEADKLTKFIDIQNSIVILTNGNKFIFANKKFFDFFGFIDLEIFLQRHNCICELFIKHENFFDLSQVKSNEKNWVESLQNLSGRQQIVSMVDKVLIPHAFSVSINSFDESTYIVNFSDISDTMHEKLQLEQEVIKDQLTKAYNRTYFDKNIKKLVHFHSEDNKKTGIIFFDIDHFKDVNDTYGHQVGDYILKTLVHLVKTNIRSNDKIIRWGGEEFIIIAPTNSINELYNLAEGLREKIEYYNFDSVKDLTCSFGVYIHIGGTEILTSIKNADDKLYQAKNQGRNRVIS